MRKSDITNQSGKTRKMQDINAYDKSVIQLIISALTVLPYVLIKNQGAALDWNVRSVLIILIKSVYILLLL